VAHRKSLRLNREPADHPPSPFGEDVVEEHRIDSAENEIAERMQIVFVGDRGQPIAALSLQQDFVSKGADERRNLLVPQILESS
jgi:hypothetical protein